MSGSLRKAGSALALLVLLVGAVFAVDLFDVRTQLLGEEVPEAREPATSPEAQDASSDDDATPEATHVRSNPWWQEVTTLDGEGDASEDVTIDEGALQWRLEWQCESGELTVDAAGHSEPLIDASCPEEGTTYSTQAGENSLDVETDGPWELVVSQQIDVPLEEDPLPEMEDPEAEVVAWGTFYDIDQTGRGEVIIYRLPDDSYALRLDEFFVTPNIDLEIRLSPQEEPKTTEEFDLGASEYVETLQPTTGSMNFPIPEDVDPTKYESVVIWCPPVQNAYAAATLSEPE